MNGISPVFAIILTLIVACITVLLFVNHHIVWGVIFAIICVDFFADVVLSFKKSYRMLIIALPGIWMPYTC